MVWVVTLQLTATKGVQMNFINYKIYKRKHIFAFPSEFYFILMCCRSVTQVTEAITRVCLLLFLLFVHFIKTKQVNKNITFYPCSSL